ncbi:MAG: response regulator, partial [Gemmatimonadetes bacterium]|nr:response regulator [Gemmatimonadota bacterium]
PLRGEEPAPSASPAAPEIAPSDGILVRALDQAPDLAVVRVDRNGRIRFWPERARRILDWSSAEAVGRPLGMVLAEPDRPGLRSRLTARPADSAEWLVELLSRSGDRIPCGVRVLAPPASRASEGDEDVFVILRDRRAEEASERWLRWSRALLSVLGTGTLVLDPGGRVRELGAGWLPDARLRPLEWLGRHMADLFESDRREVLAALRTTAREEEWTGNLVLDGAPIRVVLRAVRDDDDNLEAIVGARLPDSVSEARELFREIPVGMLIVDPNFRVLETNPELAAVVGDSALPAEPVGLDVRSLSIFQTRAAQTALDSLPEQGSFDLPEVHLNGASGESLVVQLRAKELTDDHGQRTGYLLMLLGRGGRTHVERQLLRAQKMESIGNFASGLAHDFGNFVSVILGKAGVLRVKLPDDPHITGDLDDIETAAKRAQHLSQELMKFARGGRNKVTPMSINKMVSEVGALIRTSVGQKISVDFRLDDHVPEIQGDEVELQQMLLNLCLNARDAMPNGGHLRIETRPLSEDQSARLGNVDRARGGCCLSVRDDGTGMPPEVLERIFEPFFTTKEESNKGTGLGLAMVYGIVRRHGGTIDVQSRPNVGTTFEILLPAAVAPADHRDGLKILVVDDEPAFREMIQIILEEDGHSVKLAANGIEALKALRHETKSLTLVILDLRMPGIDGLGVLDELQQLAPDLPVLVTTGYASAEEKEEALARGADRLLEKPYRVADLRTAVAEVLASRAAGASSDGSVPA